MKRLRRIAWNAIAALSAMLCVSVAVLLVRQRAVQQDQIDYVWSGHFYISAESVDGSILLWMHRPWPSNDTHRGFHYGKNFASSRPMLQLDVDEAHPYRDIYWEILGSQVYRAHWFMTGDTDGAVHWTNDATGGEILLQPSIVVLYANIPALYLLLLFSVAPGIYILRRILRRIFIRKPGCCKKCGYDLRATPDKCPECGTIPADRQSGTA